MSLLDPLLGVANVSEALSSSSSSSAGGSITLSAPALQRKYSGKFTISASISCTTPGGGTQGATIQVLSSLIGAVGPTITTYGASADGGVLWVDYSGIDVGATVQYSVKVAPISGSNSISIAAGAAAITVHEI